MAPPFWEAVVEVEGVVLPLPLGDEPTDMLLEKEGAPDTERELEGKGLALRAPLGDRVIAREGEPLREGARVGVGQAEGFTDSPVAAQADGQVQGMGAPTPEGQ